MLFFIPSCFSVPKAEYLASEQNNNKENLMKRPGMILFVVIICTMGCQKSEKESPTEPDNSPAAGDYYVDVYDSSRVFQGTTLFTDSHDPENMRVVEVDMAGAVIWEFTVPQNWLIQPVVGFDAELLPNGNILLVLSNTGLFEIDRNGTVVWQHLDPRCSHDADRLNNGNTLYIFGNSDVKSDSCVKEVDANGNVVWSWKAFNYYNESPYNEISYQGWCHANAVTRMGNGHTLISIRNFDMTVEVDAAGNPVWEFHWQDLYPATTLPAFYPHEPEIHSDNTLMVCLQVESPYQVVEIDKGTGEVKWEYHRDNFRTCRDADGLPNGNVLIVGVMTDWNESVIYEVTQDKEIVWELRLYDIPVDRQPGHFFKAQRIAL